MQASSDLFWGGGQRWRGDVSTVPISIGGKVEEGKEKSGQILKRENKMIWG